MFFRASQKATKSSPRRAFVRKILSKLQIKFKLVSKDELSAHTHTHTHKEQEMEEYSRKRGKKFTKTQRRKDRDQVIPQNWSLHG